MEALIIILAIIAMVAIFLYFKKSYEKPVNIGEEITKKEEYGKRFQFLIVDDYGEAPLGSWYRLDSWKRPNLLRMESTWDKDWKSFSLEENVVGVSFDRQNDFLIMGDQEDFKIFLERERNNPVDPNAIKVIGSATVNGQSMVKQLGYLSKETAKSLKDEIDLDARPRIVYFPNEERNCGLRIQVLVRSARYKKKMKKL